MTTVSGVMDALVEAFGEIPGLNVVTRVPESFAFPSLLIIPPDIPTMSEDLGDGSIRLLFTSFLLVASAANEDIRQFTEYLEPVGPKSLFGKLEEHRREFQEEGFDARVLGFPRQMTFDEAAAYRAYGKLVSIQVFAEVE